MQNNRKIKRKVRSSYFISTISIALVLFLCGSVSYMILSALKVTEQMKESITIHVMLDKDITVQSKTVLRDRLIGADGIKSVKFVSKEEAAAEFIKHEGSDFLEFLEFNPLPDSYEVNFLKDGSETETLDAFEKEVSAWDGVDEVVYQKGIIDQISTNLNKFNIILLLFGCALLVISVILLNNTIRVSVLSKRYIISTMKLVGATKGFIIKPFVGKSILQGIFAGTIASVLFVALLWGLHEGLPEIRFAEDTFHNVWIIAGMYLAGILISLIFTIFAVNKFSKMPANAVHLY